MAPHPYLRNFSEEMPHLPSSLALVKAVNLKFSCRFRVEKQRQSATETIFIISAAEVDASSSHKDTLISQGHIYARPLLL